jgi:hypothetical protein
MVLTSLAHSIRDSIVDDAFLAEMKSKKVIYVPTLTLDKFRMCMQVRLNGSMIHSLKPHLSREHMK